MLCPLFPCAGLLIRTITRLILDPRVFRESPYGSAGDSRTGAPHRTGPNSNIFFQCCFQQAVRGGEICEEWSTLTDGAQRIWKTCSLCFATTRESEIVSGTPMHLCLCAAIGLLAHCDSRLHWQPFCWSRSERRSRFKRARRVFSTLAVPVLFAYISLESLSSASVSISHHVDKTAVLATPHSVWSGAPLFVA